MLCACNSIGYYPLINVLFHHSTYRAISFLTIYNNKRFYATFCYGHSSLTNEKDRHYFLNRFVCVGEFFDG